MSWQSPLTDRLGIAHPIIQAPMAGGGDTPALVAAVAEAGGIGFLGAQYLSPDAIAAAAHEVRERTDRPFGINLFAPQPVPEDVDSTGAVAHVTRFYAELGLPAPEPPGPSTPPFDAQLAAGLESGAAAFSFTMGLPPADAVAAIKDRGMLLIATATTVAEAARAAAAGSDAIVAQGAEAGGHRGTFPGARRPGLVGTMALVPQVVDAVDVPVIASGGIMDGRGIVAALALGAVAVQMGTAFLVCDEAGPPPAYKQAILQAADDGTAITRAFSGRWARGVRNRFLDETPEDAILPFPMQNALTRPMRTVAAQRGEIDYLSIWSGQGTRLARAGSAAALMARLVEEMAATRARLG
jgi:nitronate monooxygenase